MEFKDLFLLSIQLQSEIDTVWSAYGAFGVVLIGWLMQVKSDLGVKHKVIATIFIVFVCSYLLGKQISSHLALSIINDQLYHLASENSENRQLLEAVYHVVPVYVFASYHLVLFFGFSLLVWNNRIWRNIRSA